MARKDIHGARRVVASTLTLAVCLGIILGIILGFGGESVMLLLAGEASRDVIPLALQVTSPILPADAHRSAGAKHSIPLHSVLFCSFSLYYIIFHFVLSLRLKRSLDGLFTRARW